MGTLYRLHFHFRQLFKALKGVVASGLGYLMKFSSSQGEFLSDFQ